MSTIIKNLYCSYKLKNSRMLRPKLLYWLTALDYSTNDKKAYFTHQNLKQRETLQEVLCEKKDQFKESGQILHNVLQEKKERFKESGQILHEVFQEKKERFKESGQMLHGALQEKKERFKESRQILLHDIKETRNKMREKMEEVIEVSSCCFVHLDLAI